MQGKGGATHTTRIPTCPNAESAWGHFGGTFFGGATFCFFTLGSFTSFTRAETFKGNHKT